METGHVSGMIKVQLVKRLLAGERPDVIARETGLVASVLKDWEGQVVRAASRALCSEEERQREVRARLGEVVNKPRNKRDQGYWDRLQRSRSWLIAAQDYDGDLDIMFICHWIAVNALFGGLAGPVERRAGASIVRHRFKTLKLVPPDIREFARRISGLDTGGRVAQLLKEKVSDVNWVIKDKWHFKLFWERGTAEAVEELRGYLEDAKAARERGDHGAHLAILLWRIGEIRHHVLHGAATYCVSQNRDSVRRALGLLKPLVPCLLDILYGEGALAERNTWPPVPKPRVGSHQNPDALSSA